MNNRPALALALAERCTRCRQYPLSTALRTGGGQNECETCGVASIGASLEEVTESEITRALKLADGDLPGPLGDPLELVARYGWAATELMTQRATETYLYLQGRFSWSGLPSVSERQVLWRAVPGTWIKLAGPEEMRRLDWTEIRVEHQSAAAAYHDKPAPHLDFLFYTVTARPQDLDMWEQLGRISTSITYDRQHQQVTAGCHFRGAAVATLSLIMEFFRGKRTLAETVAAYDGRIMQLAREQQELIRTMKMVHAQAKGDQDGFAKRWLAYLSRGALGPDDQNNLATSIETPLTDIYERYLLRAAAKTLRQ